MSAAANAPANTAAATTAVANAAATTTVATTAVATSPMPMPLDSADQIPLKEFDPLNIPGNVLHMARPESVSDDTPSMIDDDAASSSYASVMSSLMRRHMPPNEVLKMEHSMLRHDTFANRDEYTNARVKQFAYNAIEQNVPEYVKDAITWYPELAKTGRLWEHLFGADNVSEEFVELFKLRRVQITDHAFINRCMTLGQWSSLQDTLTMYANLDVSVPPKSIDDILLDAVKESRNRGDASLPDITQAASSKEEAEEIARRSNPFGSLQHWFMRKSVSGLVEYLETHPNALEEWLNEPKLMAEDSIVWVFEKLAFTKPAPMIKQTFEHPAKAWNNIVKFQMWKEIPWFVMTMKLPIAEYGNILLGPVMRHAPKHYIRMMERFGLDYSLVTNEQIVKDAIELGNRHVLEQILNVQTEEQINQFVFAMDEAFTEFDQWDLFQHLALDGKLPNLVIGTIVAAHSTPSDCVPTKMLMAHPKITEIMTEHFALLRSHVRSEHDDAVEPIKGVRTKTARRLRSSASTALHAQLQDIQLTQDRVFRILHG